MPVDTFTVEEFNAALPGFVHIGLDQGEHCWRKELQFCDILIRSSIGASGISAALGKDSIRCWICERNTTRPLAKKLQRWTTRIPGWETRLNKQIAVMEEMSAFIQPCPTCGTTMRIVEISRGQNTGKLAVSCPAKDTKGNFLNHHFELIEEGEEQEETPTCPTCNRSLSKVTIKRGKNTGKQAWTCSAKDEQGNFLNHHFQVIE